MSSRYLMRTIGSTLTLRTSNLHLCHRNAQAMIPIVLDKTGMHERAYDIYSRLLKDRIICLMGPINDDVSSLIIAQLLYLQSEDKRAPIHMYINSPGGVVTAGLAIYDTMQYIKPRIATWCVGQACSMGSLLLAAGSPGFRYALPHCRVMVHQPSGRADGQASDIEIHAQEIIKMRKMLNSIYAKHTGQSISPQSSVYGSPTLNRRVGLSVGSHNTTSNPVNATINKNENSLLDKLNTIARVRRRNMEAQELEAEAKQAMEEPLHPIAPDLGPGGYNLAEGEERSMIEPYSKENPQVMELTKNLIEWINAELLDDRILVRDLESDIYDGQVLQKLVEKLTGNEINHPEVTQTEMGQRQRLYMVLDLVNRTLDLPQAWAEQRWSAAAIHSRDLVAILRLLVALAKHFAPMIRLPKGVTLTVLIVRKINGILQHRRQAETITEFEDAFSTDVERDAISALVDCAVPENLAAFQETLLEFINRHLNKLNLHVNSIETEMDDGVYFIILLGLLGGYFVPLHSYFVAPVNNEQRLANLQLVLQLAQETEGIGYGSSSRADDLLRHDLKSTLRLIYGLYARYKDSP